MASDYDLTREEIQALSASHFISSASIDGKRKVSAALLSPPSAQESSSSGSRASAYVRIRAENPGLPFDLPENDESVAAVEFCGFTRERAERIHERWATRHLPNPDNLIQYMIGDLNHIISAALASKPPAEAMTAVGVSAELQDAIMDPQFEQVRGTETLLFWLVDTVKSRYETLYMLLERLKSHAVKTVTLRKGEGKNDISGPSQPSRPSQPDSAPISTPTNLLPLSYTSVQAPPPLLPDHYVFYKAASASKMLNDDGFIRENGEINLISIMTERGGDFNINRTAWYFHTQKEVSEQYRRYAARRNSMASTWSIRIELPKKWVDGLRKRELWYSPDWKTFVWYCRHKGSKGLPPTELGLDEYFRVGGAQFIEGHVCKNASGVWKMKWEDVQVGLGEEDVLCNGDMKATQSVFLDDGNSALQRRLEEEARGKVFIEIYPPMYNT